MQRFLDPAVLSAISGLDLVAKTVVDGFVAGLHRSADFGFSQEFAEYRAYSQGDDLRHVDWNVFARTERAYLKRYRGETNTQLLLLVDTSASMGFGSHAVNKLDFARYMAACLCYMASHQRDATGLPHLTAEQMGDVMLFLNGDAASGISGVNLLVDAGHVMSSSTGSWAAGKALVDLLMGRTQWKP